jgi:hypothetical protein
MDTEDQDWIQLLTKFLLGPVIAVTLGKTLLSDLC